MKINRTVKKLILFNGLWALLITHCPITVAQTIYQYQADSATICFINKQQAQYVPHLMRKYQSARTLHGQIWGGLPAQSPFMLLTDMEDDGNAGVSALPHSFIQIGLAPNNKSFFVYPSPERFDYVFKHEYAHVVMADKANSTDDKWRKFTGNKVVPNPSYPLSALWSYLDVPRWYAPRWYHEGIACFLETWLCGGAGRSLSGYDEAYFRTQVMDGKDFYSIVGLETEGSTSDFQQGATAYLYGTRFVNYLVLQYGFDKMVEFYNRTDDSETFYAKQFEKVYGKGLREVWSDWQAFETEHQKENLKRVEEYPLTEVRKLVEKNLGSMSPLIIDEENRVSFAAVNHPGDFASIVRIRIDESGRMGTKIEKLANIDGYKTYQPAYLTYDKKGQRLIWTDRNSGIRGIVVYDLNKGRITDRLKFQRMYDLSYDNANDCMYALLSNQGVCHLVRCSSDLSKKEVLYSFPFGVSVSDLDVSHDGTRLVASLQGTRGEHSLIMFDVRDLDDAKLGYNILQTFDDSNLSQFRFSYDDSKLVGFSYYTGVPNIWSFDLETESLDLVSNVQGGLFAPYLASGNLLYALEYSSNGMTPVTFEYKVIHDANSIDFLGQKVYGANPVVAELSQIKRPVKEITFGEVYDSIKVYKPFNEIKFQGIYPDLSGFTDRKAWNNVTPVLGAHLAFYDPLSLLSVNLFVGASPWSNNDWKNRFHISTDIKYYRWTLSAAWNPTNFYDLFGPRRSSRNGYNVALSYDTRYTLSSPFTWQWGGSIAHYGDMDALPLYQEIAVDEGITSFQTFSLYAKCGKVHGTIGAIEAERGYRLSANAYSYLADGRFYPSIDVSGDFGFLIPVGEHNSFWLKTAAGQNFGDVKSALGNTYFGGFRNNYIDNGEINRYRTVSAFPGARIDQISAHSYAKFTGEIDFCPIRFNNFGALKCYPNYIRFSLFASGLLTDHWGSNMVNKANYLSCGAQMNIPLVLFTHMATTLSVGYARLWGNDLNRGELMISLKLL